jgi:hypothetical protein
MRIKALSAFITRHRAAVAIAIAISISSNSCKSISPDPSLSSMWNMICTSILSGGFT